MRVSSWLYLIGQMCISACLLTSIGLCAGLRRRHPGRIFAVSAFLALLTMAAHSLPPWLRLLLLAAVSWAAPCLAWPAVPRRLRLRMAGLSGLMSLILTGLMRLIAPLPLPGAILLMLGCAATSAMPRAVTHASNVPMTTTVDVRFGSRSLMLTALIDSGNLLRDMITGLPVIVISRRAAEKLLPGPAGAAPFGGVPVLRGMRLMPVRTISGTSMMTILRPDSLRILTAGPWQEAQALIGLAPDGYDGFQALVPSCLVRGISTLPDPQQISQGG